MSLSAFPQIVTEYDDSLHEYTNNVHSVGGMDLRDYFAAKALQGMLAEGYVPDRTVQWSIYEDLFHDVYAKQAYLMADAMLKARGE